MEATQDRYTTCPECGRRIAVRKDTGEIARHGPHGRTCPGSMTIPGPRVVFTAEQKAFVNECWRIGDALPVARMLGIPYPHCRIPQECWKDPDAALVFLVQNARAWIRQAVLHREAKVSA